MNAKFTRLLMALAVILAFIVSTNPAAAATYYFNFSSSLLPWVKGNDPGAAASSLTLSGEDNSCPTSGGGHARLTAWPSYTPFSGLWMASRFPAAARNVEVKVTFAIKEQYHCPTCYAIVYLGDTMPTSSATFITLGSVGSTWTTYSYTAIGTSTTGSVVVAIGWKGMPSSLPAAVGIDCVEVSITP
jgi:hypothetical protein